MTVNCITKVSRNIQDYLMKGLQETYGNNMVEPRTIEYKRVSSNPENHSSSNGRPLKIPAVHVIGTGLVVIIDHFLTIEGMKGLDATVEECRDDLPNLAYVFYKDDDDYFRRQYGITQCKSKQFALNRCLSDKENERLISFRAEEDFVYRKNKWLQYFDPSLDGEPALVSFKFTFVPMKASAQFDERMTESGIKEIDKLRIWTKQLVSHGKLRMDNDLVW